MSEDRSDAFEAFVFKNRGALLAAPAAVLAACGKPSALSVTLGLPLAIAGELIRCWAVGFSGVTTRGDVVEAPKLVTAGPYAYVRNPLYLGNFVTAAGFAIAFTGKNSRLERLALTVAALGTMIGVYSIIVPHEEKFLQSQFGEEFERYCERVPPVIPQAEPMPDGEGEWRPEVIAEAESKTFATFGAMLAALAVKALRA
ncbi:MAG: isoprenylcysteine carboxylmethyltransferase family protein [Candidatus Eremiobacteraeota bacterium]|nr:isoprenylcysteine carboxylmethyltransferase family protein [Candidatus Eremiobacteraeota bacterium]MBV8434742.1 isoprenylcysteine carboxylmethyltransferase family protein [Candidatus Eremiobacteraeota bacterium]MBV8722963.1 isoprenylcysteine carboxylmethyltransferase family protein [Candidatus Eremiobacteraeota bacterium]